MDRTGEEFPFYWDIRQGDHISLKLLISLIEEVIYRIKEDYVLDINRNKLLNRNFADDIALITVSQEEGKGMLKEFAIWSKPMGFILIYQKN